ncbi:MAG: polyprenyl diphosphate synthase, partial [Fimbriimonadales bacterium]
MQAIDWRGEAARRGVDLTRLPRHIAMIMDGNGRWAKARGLHRLVGHANGHSTVRRMVLGCAELGIKALSLYTFSTENWRRPQEEVEGLMRLLERSAREELPVMMRNGVQIRFSGRIEELSPPLQALLRRAEQLTAHNQRIILHLAINYGGRAELVDAMRAIAREVQAGRLEPDAIDEHTDRPFEGAAGAGGADAADLEVGRGGGDPEVKGHRSREGLAQREVAVSHGGRRRRGRRGQRLVRGK